MPTIMTHPAPMLALAAGLGTNIISPRLAVAAACCAVLPDLDVAGFWLGVQYMTAFGHRGASHSLVFALAVGVLGWLSASFLHSGRLKAFFVLFLAFSSHILLDAMTTGNFGVAVFWPFTAERYVLPWHPIRVSPLSPRAFLTERGLAVLLSELRWVWLPSLGLFIFLRLFRLFSQKERTH